MRAIVSGPMRRIETSNRAGSVGAGSRTIAGGASGNAASGNATSGIAAVAA